jgi:probable addiction module antidote protein
MRQNILHRDPTKGALNTPKLASKHISMAIHNGSRKPFLLAIRDVVDANGGISRIARKTKLTPKSLYKMLSNDGNPEIESLWRILRAMGLKFCVRSAAGGA